jgi:hypothetical protein
MGGILGVATDQNSRSAKLRWISHNVLPSIQLKLLPESFPRFISALDFFVYQFVFSVYSF